MAPMNRRSFLAGLTAAPIVAACAPKGVKAAKVAPVVDDTLSGRIVRSLERRKSLGQKSGAICISSEGHERLQSEWGCEDYDPAARLTVRGVPCVRVPEITAADDYWVVERFHRG